MIQFDDPACLLFTSVSPQTGFISKFRNKNALWFRALEWGATVRLLEPAGHLEEDYPITTFFESKTLKFFFQAK